ncbi:SKI/DACH domain-containing protein 1-like [Schistocerca americana]|uniref:SKI/DACH domain-containing protein 1-like n=1 Tax=Schistocerca americana TaxID=7009 RepID=UPI001F5033C0|nr:SKI/DACH domain-containing protein 1-like [Schistocerca americana]
MKASQESVILPEVGCLLRRALLRSTNLFAVDAPQAVEEAESCAATAVFRELQRRPVEAVRGRRAGGRGRPGAAAALAAAAAAAARGGAHALRDAAHTGVAVAERGGTAAHRGLPAARPHDGAAATVAPAPPPAPRPRLVLHHPQEALLAPTVAARSSSCSHHHHHHHHHHHNCSPMQALPHSTDKPLYARRHVTIPSSCGPV